MYIKKIIDANIGPIKHATIEFDYSENKPKPVVLVGENGTGKSALLSNVVDSLYEIAGEAFSDARQPADTEGYQYYKSISPTEIHIGQQYMYSYIEYEDLKCNPAKVEYIYKSGKLTPDEFSINANTQLPDTVTWGERANYKKAIVTKENAESIFSRDILCYFGPDRYEKPFWMGNRYYKLSDYEHPTVKQKWAGKLENPISINDVINTTLQWLLDVIVDSRCDIGIYDAKFNIEHININDLISLGVARTNVETIMSNILGVDVYFGLNLRNNHGSRFNIRAKKDNSVVVPTFDALSTGQSALFNMFATIVRYSDSSNINNSIRLSDITGIAIIDEIELHLHSTLQRETLPKLIALFPKVQFIITSHSPLFLLGMKEKFGDKGFNIFEMPEAQQISAEQFSEFENAYRYFSDTRRFKQEILEAIGKQKGKTLIITEGATDWKHMTAAYKALQEDPRCSEWLPTLDFEFLEYEPENSSIDSQLKLKMSVSQLEAMCEQYCLVPQQRKMIFVADRDVPKYTEILCGTDKYKNWGNSVFSFCLPIPNHRTTTPGICIEHLYTDEEIKREVVFPDGKKRRIFLGNEFDCDGFSVTAERYYCKSVNCCGPDKIDIIDGSDKKKVTMPWIDTSCQNYALPKMDFATRILNANAPFDNMDFSNFIPLFEIIRDILS